MAIGTPALRTSHAQGTPTSAHLSRRQNVQTSAHTKALSVRERLSFVQESTLEETVVLGERTFHSQIPDQENVAPPAITSTKKTRAVPKRSITFAADTYTNESPRTSARSALSLRGDAVPSPRSRNTIGNTSSTFTKQAVRGDQTTAPQHLDDSDEEMLASAWGDVAIGDETAAGMGIDAARQQLAPTPELSQETNVRSSVLREIEIPSFRPWSREPDGMPAKSNERLPSRPAAESSSRLFRVRDPTIASSITPNRTSSKRRTAGSPSSISISPSKSPNPRIRKYRRTTLGVSASLPELLATGSATPVRSQRTKARPIPATDKPVRQRKSIIKPASRRSIGSNESTSSRIDRRSRRRSVAPDYLSKRAGTINVPEPTSPGDDPLLLKGSVSRRKSLSRRRIGANESQDFSMMMDQYNSPSLPLASQMTPRRHRDMRDVSMTSPGADSPSPSERKLAARKASRSTSVVPPAYDNSMISPSPSRPNLIPGSGNRSKSTALPVLLGKALANAKATASAQGTEVERHGHNSSYGAETRTRDTSAEDMADPEIQIQPKHLALEHASGNCSDDEPAVQEAQQWEFIPEDEQGQEEESSQEHEEERRLPTPQDSDFPQPPVRQQTVDFSDVGQEHSDQWMAADEWLMNERDSVSPAPRTAVVQSKSSPVFEEDENDPESNAEEASQDAVMLSPSKPAQQQARDTDEETERSTSASADDKEACDEESEEESEEDQSTGNDALERSMEESTRIEEPPRSTVVVRLSVTTVKVEPEEYGLWAVTDNVKSPTTSTPPPLGHHAHAAVISPIYDRRNARSGNHSQESQNVSRSPDVAAHSANQGDSASKSSAEPLSPSEKTDRATVPDLQVQQPTSTSKIYPESDQQMSSIHKSEIAPEKAENGRTYPIEDKPLRNQQQPSGVMQVVLQQLKERSRLSTSTAEGTQTVDNPLRSTGQAIRVRAYESSDDEDDDPCADQSVVEVYSRDPAAAARAAAILKMNYNYIEHGYAIPVATTPRKSVASNRISLTATGPRITRQSAVGKKRMSLAEMLHEAELDLAIGPVPTTPSGGGSRRPSSAGSLLEMPGALPPSTRRKNRSSPMKSGIAYPVTPPKAHDKPWKPNDWRELEKAYRRTERRFSKLPQRSVLEKSAPKASADPDIIIDTFMHMQGLAEEDLRGEWGRSILVMRIQALGRRIAEDPGLPQTASSSQSGRAEENTNRPCKRARIEDDEDDVLETPNNAALAGSTTANRLTSFFKGLQSHLPRPSLSMLSSPTVSRSLPLVPAKTSSRDPDSTIDPPPQMRQVGTATLQSVPTTRSLVVGPSFTTQSATSQHSQAIKALFPGTNPTTATRPIPIPVKAAAKAPIRLSQGSSQSHTPSVKDLIRSFDSFEDVSGLANGDISGSSLRRVTSSSSLRAGKTVRERRLTDH